MSNQDDSGAPGSPSTSSVQDNVDAILAQLKQQQEQEEANQQQQQASLLNQDSRPQSSGIGSFGNNAASGLNNYNSVQSMLGSSSGAGTAGFAGASTPAIGAGTGEGSSALFGLGGASEMAGGEAGSGLFTLGGAGGSAAGGAAAGGGAASSGIGSAVAAGGPWALLAAAAIAGRQYMINTGKEKQSDILTLQGPTRHLGFAGDEIDKLPAGKPLGNQVADLGKIMSFRPSGFKDHIVDSMPWNVVKDIF